MTIDSFFSKASPSGQSILRIGMGLVFLFFSYYQFSDPQIWTGYVPDWVTALAGGNALVLVLLNAWFELMAGLCLIAGFQTRAVALLLAVHLFGIAGTIGISPLGVRDLGLSVATLSIFFTGPDQLSLDRRFKDRVEEYGQM